MWCRRRSRSWAPGKVRQDAVVVAGAVVAHRRMPLSLSFDHRCITGGEACRFLAAVDRRSGKARVALRKRPCTKRPPNNIRKIVAAIVAAAARLPKSHARRRTPKRFLQAYYANVDAEDIAARDPADACRRRLVASQVRAAAARPGAGAGVQSHAARTRLHLAAHRHRDGERRHAVPRRFDRARADPARSHPAFSGAPDLRGGARQRRRPARRSRSAAAAATASISDSSPFSTSKWIASSIPPYCDPCARRSSAACATCGLPAPIGRRCRPRRARRPMT